MRGCVQICVRKRGGKARGKEERGKRGKRVLLSKQHLLCIANVNYEGTGTVTHSVKNKILIEVHSEGLAPSFVIVGIPFRSTPSISAPTF